MTTPQWSPAEVLRLDPNCLDSTCIGYAKTQRRKCRNPIAYANRQEAANILLQMSTLDPLSQRLDSKLEELASRLLCRRWHQVQAEEIKGKWQRQIGNHQAAENARRAERSRTAERPSTPSRFTVARTPVATIRIESVTSAVTTSITHESSSTAIVSVFIREESGGRGNGEAHEQEAPREQTNPQPDSPSQQQASSPESTNHQSNVPPPTSSADEPNTPTPASSIQEHAEVIGEAAQDAAIEAEPPSPVTSASPPASHPRHEYSHPAHHSHRAIEGDCSICFEDLSIAGDTTWCRAQCGQNFHAGCIDLWHASQEANEVVKTCPHCRTAWAE